MRVMNKLSRSIYLALLALGPAAGASAQPAASSSATVSSSPAWMKKPGLYAVFHTGKGTIVCRLFPAQAPHAVANFVGLAEGTKEYLDPRDGKVKTTRFYDGTKFH